MRYFAMVLAVALATPAIADPHYPPVQGKPVVDAANIIPDDLEAQLNSELFNYEHKTGHQLMVATVPSLEGYDDETYATGYFKAVKLGGRNRDDGILFLIAPKEHKVRIINGFGSSTLLTDAKTGEILHEHVTPLFKQGDFAHGIKNGVDEIIADTTPLTPAQLMIQQREKQREQAESDRRWAGIKDFFLTLFGVGVVAGTGYGLYHHFVIAPERERQRKEQEKRDADAERRQAEEEAEEDREEREAEEREAEARKAKLARMTPAQREAFLANEERQRQAAAERAYAEDQARRAEEERDRQRRQREDEEEAASAASFSSSSDDDDSSSSSSSSSDDSFSGGGGDTGGGGAGDSW